MSQMSEVEVIRAQIEKLEGERKRMSPLETPSLAWYRELRAWQQALSRAEAAQ